jgi:hypothetical protein
MRYYLIIACVLAQAYVQAMDNSNKSLHRDCKPGLYQKHTDGTVIKLPHDTWFKEKDDGHVIQPTPEKNAVPVLNGLVMMLSGAATGFCVLGASWPALCISGTILASSVIIQHQISPYLSPEEKKSCDEMSKCAAGWFALSFLVNCRKSS